MHWIEVSVTTDGEAAEAVADMLRPFAYGNGVVLEQLGDPDNLDPVALEPEVTVKIYLAGDDDGPALRRQIDGALYHMNRLYPIPPARYRELKEEDWATAWRKNYRPFRVGRRLWIHPSWLEMESVGLDEVVITLDPGMAFGTGLHPSTQMCLQAIEEIMQPGSHVVDVGTGSGILAIAAAKLGASFVVALDTDPIAVKTAAHNAVINGVSSTISAYHGVLSSVHKEPWDLVLVNILAPVIVSLVKEGDLLTYVSANGRLVLSGIIEEQVQNVTEVINTAGGKIVRCLTIRDWVTLIVARK